MKEGVIMSSNKSVLVTGASKGIGRAIALGAAKAGYDVIVHYGSDKAGGEKTLEGVLEQGVQGRLQSFDIANRASCRETLEADISEHGAYYGVILNAGIARDNAFPALEDEEWDQVIRTNLDGFYNVIKPLVMPMVRRRASGRGDHAPSPHRRLDAIEDRRESPLEVSIRGCANQAPPPLPLTSVDSRY